ncbi:MAG: hypothetical protein JWM59_4357 [Verrucomicrobiales bacterium]|nr:hypothetical protein [Verrucomicrobiales bacterium]
MAPAISLSISCSRLRRSPRVSFGAKRVIVVIGEALRLTALGNVPYDVILMDYRMLEVDGHEPLAASAGILRSLARILSP